MGQKEKKKKSLCPKHNKDFFPPPFAKGGL